MKQPITPLDNPQYDAVLARCSNEELARIQVFHMAQLDEALERAPHLEHPSVVTVQRCLASVHRVIETRHAQKGA
ncbi:MAG: hypothetical protein DI582_08380 [Azospirillum brasilense]|nr:MAG: hypothetical protein DI582_08380 [Azospirillum brasilense]